VARDYICLEEVILHVKVGTVEEERIVGQPIRFDVKIGFDAQPSAQTDHLQDTINYVEVYERMQKASTSRPFALLESLGEQIAASLLELDVTSVWVKAQKVRCPIPGMMGKIAVEIYREKQ
jgi:dihydroneopterin aldolase